MLYALPMLLFAGVFGTPLAEITRNASLFVWIMVGMVGGLILVFLASVVIVRSPVDLAALRALAIAGPSVPFIGTPVLGVLYPSEASLAVAVSGLIINLVQIPLALIFLSDPKDALGARGKSPLAAAMKGVAKVIKEPVVWAPVLAFVLLLLGLDMPAVLKGSFILLRKAAVTGWIR